VSSAWRPLGVSFLAGALLDLPFGAAILAAPGLVAPLLGVTLPEGRARVYFDLNGLFLLALGALYLAVWREPRRLAPVAALGGVLRIGGFVLFSAAVARGRADRFFLLIGATELVLGLCHLALLARARRAEAAA
jgi:hypothetical protein